jgi:uncharacterized protein YegL
MAEQVAFGGLNLEFARNPEPRVPCVLLLDTSGSMGGTPIEELNAGVSLCKSSMLADLLAAKRVELAIVTFGGGVNVACDFATVEHFNPPPLVADGDTPMGTAISKAIGMVTQRKAVYKANGVAYYRPWIFLITDGAPTDHWDEAAQQVQEGENNSSFVFFSVGVEGADFSILKRLSKKREPLKLKGLNFRDLFQWLSSSLSSVSHSKQNEPAKMENPTAPTGWAEIPTGN